MPLTVFQDGPATALPQSFSCGHGHKLLAIIPAHPPGERRQPHLTRVIHAHRAHGIIYQAIRHRIGDGFSPIVAHDPGRASPGKPHLALVVLGDGPRQIVPHPALALDHPHPLLCGPAPDVAAVVGQPHSSLAIGIQLQGDVVPYILAQGKMGALSPIVPRHPLERPQPQLPRRILGQAQQRVVKQPVGRGESGHVWPLVPAHATSLGAEPLISLAIFPDEDHLVIGQPLGGSKADKLLAIPAAHPVRIGRQPQVPLPVLGHGHHPVGLPSRFSEGHQPLAVNVVEPLFSTDPQSAGPVLEHGMHPLAGQPILPGERGPLLPVIATDAPHGAGPQSPGAVFVHIVDPLGGHTQREGLEVLAVIPGDLPVQAEPQGPGPVFANRAGKGPGQAIGRGKRHPLFPVVPGHPLARKTTPPPGSKPQVSVPVFQHGIDRVIRQAIRHGEVDELGPIKPAHPIPGPEPHLPLAILQDGADQR